MDGDDRVPPPPVPAADSPESSFDSDVSPAAFAGHAVAPRQAKRGGYSNLGQGMPEIADNTGLVGDDNDDRRQQQESEEEEADGGFVAATTARRKKMSYVGLGDGGADSAADELSDSGKEEGGGAAAGAGGGSDNASGRLAIFGLLNLAYVVLQLMGAMAFSSLALMSDGFHNLSDV